jgi:hypothetical protein
MFDRTLPLTEQGGQRALTAEAPDDPLGCVHSIFHGAENNDFFVIWQAMVKRNSTTWATRVRLVALRVLAG